MAGWEQVGTLQSACCKAQGKKFCPGDLTAEKNAAAAAASTVFNVWLV